MKKLTICLLVLAGATSAMAQDAPVNEYRGEPISDGLVLLKTAQDPLPTEQPQPFIGISENDPTIDFVLYPNPTSAVLNIRLDIVGEPVFANILDMTGRVVLSEVSLSSGINTIQVESLGSGTYICQLHTDETPLNLKRFIVK
ncbi:MAG: T9SS type A sorting domain-containing protein [Crocinitomicaceae bacterium]|nr:T9SS type A sorting domain-containing protein [Crocinitomicaceae bacterium]